MICANNASEAPMTSERAGEWRISEKSASEMMAEIEQLRAWQRARLETDDLAIAEREKLRAALRIARRWMPICPIDQEAKDEVAAVETALA